MGSKVVVRTPIVANLPGDALQHQFGIANRNAVALGFRGDRRGMPTLVAVGVPLASCSCNPGYHIITRLSVVRFDSMSHPSVNLRQSCHHHAPVDMDASSKPTDRSANCHLLSRDGPITVVLSRSFVHRVSSTPLPHSRSVGIALTVCLQNLVETLPVEVDMWDAQAKWASYTQQKKQLNQSKQDG